MDVKRYGPRTMESGSQGDYYTVFDESPDGQWVRYTDYAALEAELTVLQGEKVLWKKAGIEQHDTILRLQAELAALRVALKEREDKCLSYHVHHDEVDTMLAENARLTERVQALESIQIGSVAEADLHHWMARCQALEASGAEREARLTAMDRVVATARMLEAWLSHHNVRDLFDHLERRDMYVRKIADLNDALAALPEAGGGKAEGGETCARCGEMKESAKHIRYGNDRDNPLKHDFQAEAGGEGEQA